MIVAYAGHRVDAPGRDTDRFPAHRVPAVARRVLRSVQSLSPSAVVGAAAAGADLLVLDAALQVGAQVHVVLPYPREVFRARSVADCGPDWEGVFDRVLAQVPAQQVSVAGGDADDANAGDGGDAYERANVAILDAAQALARRRTEPLVALVVRSRRDGGAPSVSDHFADLAAARGLDVVDIDTGG